MELTREINVCIHVCASGSRGLNSRFSVCELHQISLQHVQELLVLGRMRITERNACAEQRSIAAEKQIMRSKLTNEFVFYFTSSACFVFYNRCIHVSPRDGSNERRNSLNCLIFAHYSAPKFVNFMPNETEKTLNARLPNHCFFQ